MEYESQSQIEELLRKYFTKIKEPVLLYEGIIKCPLCESMSLHVKEFLYEVPYFGPLLISTGKCTKCGYKHRDVRIGVTTNPKKIVVKVEGEKELRYLLVKSAYASIIIPERNYEITPGPASTGFITTVEGVLHRILEALNVVCKDSEREGCRENYEWLGRAIEGKEDFTLIICDYEGASKVLGDNVVEIPIDDFCLSKKPEWMMNIL